jgi:hypothetical protein
VAGAQQREEVEAALGAGGAQPGALQCRSQDGGNEQMFGAKQQVPHEGQSDQEAWEVWGRARIGGYPCSDPGPP